MKILHDIIINYCVNLHFAYNTEKGLVARKFETRRKKMSYLWTIIEAYI